MKQRATIIEVAKKSGVAARFRCCKRAEPLRHRLKLGDYTKSNSGLRLAELSQKRGLI